jgi:3'(2'), 5'-bisphosphate nucleotidase
MSDDFAELARGCCAIARTAGRAILEVYDGDFAVERKEDDSPLTAADLAAHRAIVSGLQVLTPRIPVLSENRPNRRHGVCAGNGLATGSSTRSTARAKFVKRNGEFTVNIALIHEHRPVLGVVYAPVLDEMFWGWQGGHAFASTPAQPGFPQNGKVELRTRSRGMPLLVAGSRSHADPRTLAALDKLGPHELKPLGSSLKFCAPRRARSTCTSAMG